jgi:hypothetical protein
LSELNSPCIKTFFSRRRLREKGNSFSLSLVNESEFHDKLEEKFGNSCGIIEKNSLK